MQIDYAKIVDSISNREFTFKELLHEFERKILIEALNRFENNREKASYVLGIGRTTLVEKMRKTGILLLMPSNHGVTKPMCLCGMGEIAKVDTSKSDN